LSWVLYVFLDYYQILKDVAKITKEIIIIDSMLPHPEIVDLESPAIEIVPMQNINLASVDGSLHWLWTRITPPGLSILLQSLSFKTDGNILYPKKLNDMLMFIISLKKVRWKDSLWDLLEPILRLRVYQRIYNEKGMAS